VIVRVTGTVERMPDTVRSILLFAAAAVLEIGGAWLIWQGVREHRGVAWAGVGIVALAGYGFVATFQPDPNFGRILAAYGGVPRWCRRHHVGTTTCLTSSGAWGESVPNELDVADFRRPDRREAPNATRLIAGADPVTRSGRPVRVSASATARK